MNKVLLDTNILLDLMLSDRPDAAAAAEFLQLTESNAARGVVSAGSLKDVYYVSKKYIGDELARDWIRFFMDVFAVAAVDKTVCGMALDSDEPDFEDGIIRAVAELESVDFILTRDAAAFETSKIKPIDAAAYVALFSS